MCRIYEWLGEGGTLELSSRELETETMPVCRGLISFFPLVVVCRAEVRHDKHGEVEKEEEEEEGSNLTLLPQLMYSSSDCKMICRS